MQGKATGPPGGRERQEQHRAVGSRSRTAGTLGPGEGINGLPSAQFFVLKKKILKLALEEKIVFLIVC